MVASQLRLSLSLLRVNHVCSKFKETCMDALKVLVASVWYHKIQFYLITGMNVTKCDMFIGLYFHIIAALTH